MNITIDSQLIEWITGNGKWEYIKQSKPTQEKEYHFICNYYAPSSIKMWSSSFGEKLIQQILVNNGIEILQQRKINNIIPDIETQRAIIEVKTRNYTTSGTAGEKILGVPFKYCEINRIVHKPIYIILVGYQEKEAREKFKLSQNTTQQKKDFLNFIWHQYKIRYIFASQLLQKENVYKYFK